MPMPTTSEDTSTDSMVFINKIMAKRGIEIQASQWVNKWLSCLNPEIISGKNIAARVVAMGLAIMVKFPLMLLTWIPFGIFLATKFISSFIAFALFCASTNQEERQDAGIQIENKKTIACFAIEYAWMILLLILGPFECLVSNLMDGIAPAEITNE